jgi:Flp pilus assembly pilin Flp
MKSVINQLIVKSGIKRAERGQTMSEYALILALVVVVGLTTWALLGTNITSVIGKVASCI